MKAKKKKKDSSFETEIKEFSAYTVSFNFNGARNFHKIKPTAKKSHLRLLDCRK